MREKNSARLGLACSMLLTACQLSTTPANLPDPPPKDCEGDTCASNAPPVDWSSANPRYNAHIAVVDTAGEPVKGATVKVGDKTAVTDDKGRVEIGPLPAVEVATVGVDKEGATPTITKATAFSSGQTTQEVTIAPLDVDKMVDVQKVTTADAKGAHLDVPARALALPDGTRATSARMQVTYFAGSGADSLVPGDGDAVNDQGAPTAMGPLGGVLYVRFDDDQKRQLNLADGQTALLELPVESTYAAQDGQVIPLWALDEVSGQWKRESSCTVGSRTTNGVTEKICAGAVDHFSYWGYAPEVDIHDVGSVGCVNTTAVAEQNACFDFTLMSLSLWHCDAKGANCKPYDYSREMFFQWDPSVAWCGVMPVDAGTYRVSVVYKTDTTRCEAVDGVKPTSGTRSKITDPLDLASFKDMLGSEVMLNFTLNGQRDCPTLCAQLPVVVTLDDLKVTPWTDRDDDGAYTLTDENVKPPFLVDCNDDDPGVRPYSQELFCVNADRNCDGVNVYKPYTKMEDVDWWRWNYECAACKGIEGAVLPLSAEVAGNRYDEDCDGLAADGDNDGVNWPEDCHDFDDRITPGKPEIPGNWMDENCDGVYLDADGDGLYNPHHVHLAAEMGIGVDKFVDCDDYNGYVNPNVPHSAEATIGKYFFYQSGNSVRRAFNYCNLFEEDGEPSWYYYYVSSDLNCDGFVTDRDGDGYAAIGNTVLGVGRDTDCNDNDPRIHPVSPTDPTCTTPANLLNDSVCNVATRAVEGGGCPILTLAGTDVITRCEETKDAEGNPTGLGVCIYDGWWDGNPLVINPGATWGPCDGDATTTGLAACPEAQTCGGPLPYTEPFTQYLQETYTANVPLEFTGMCYPSCDLDK
jgi:hypothetical protein